MHQLFNRIVPIFLFTVFIYSCNAKEYNSPLGYDLLNPEKVYLKNSLKEISGICFVPGNDSVCYAIEDEKGRLYRIGAGGNDISHYHFGPNADYEDVVFSNHQFYVLQSNGTIISILFDFATDKIIHVKNFERLIPPANYEGLAAFNDTLFVLCKVCGDVNQKDNLKIYKLLIADTAVSLIGSMEPQLPELKKQKKHGKIYPSCLAKNPLDKNWYVLSAENYTLLIFNEHFEFINAYSLNPEIYPQPEGIAFTGKGDLLISSEGKTGAGSLAYIRHK